MPKGEMCTMHCTRCGGSRDVFLARNQIPAYGEPLSFYCVQCKTITDFLIGERENRKRVQPYAERSREPAHLQREREEICAYCKSLGLQGRTVGNTVFVQSAKAEWFFNYKSTPITLYHENYEKRSRYNGQTTGYHRQYIFPTWQQTIKYIRNHDLERNIPATSRTADNS